MSSELSLRNRQHVRAVDLRLLRCMTQRLLQDLIGSQPYQLGIHLVAAAEMARLNEHFLDHKRSTDVITFDYMDSGFRVPSSELAGAREVNQLEPRTSNLEPSLQGEIFICLGDAVAQASQFRTTWQSELVRYLIHGLLHLRGYDDLKVAARKKMKREESRLLHAMTKEFTLSRLAKPNRKSQIAKRKWTSAPPA